MIPGTIMKNRRNHPERIFLVREVVTIRHKGVKTAKIYGTLVNENKIPRDTSFLLDYFLDLFPYVMWAP